MKHFIKPLALVCVLGLSPKILSYAFVNNSDSVIPVDIYVDKSQGAFESFLRKIGIGGNVLDVVDQAGKAGKSVSDVLKQQEQTKGAGSGIGTAANIVAQVASKVKEFLNPILRMKTFDAFHENVKPGNQGRHAEWNWASIKKQKGLDKGDPMFFWITQHGKVIPLFQGVIDSDGIWSFTATQRKDYNNKPIEGEYKVGYKDLGEYTGSTK